MQASGQTSLIRGAFSVFLKDVRIELRTKELLLTLGYFGFLVVLVFSFVFFRGDAPLSAVASGIIWVSLAFSGTLGLSRIFEKERENDALRALLLSPLPRPALYLGKVLGVFFFMLVVLSIVMPAVFLFFSLPFEFNRITRVFLVLGLGLVGYAFVGTLLSAMLHRARSKDVLLSVVFYPLILPVLIVGVKATAALLEPEADLAAFGVWVRLLAAYDLVFMGAGFFIFEPMIIE